MLLNVFHATVFLLVLTQKAGAESAETTATAYRGCKCTPTDSCWPSPSKWNALKLAVSGRLIKNVPQAIVCYPGPQLDYEECSELLVDLTNSTFVADDPIALGYPIDNTCAAVNYTAGETPGKCTLGSDPVYAVDAATSKDVIQAVNFARNNNVRLVIRNTGHDITGRSTGYGSLEVWIRHLRQGITFQQKYLASDKCSKSGWMGSAIKVGGGYVWGDVYQVANQQNVVVVGGGDPSVGCIGGWAQGGGHSPASRDHGLGADQILEAQVVLASGVLVTANACQNSDLFAAIRGGGGGTYGVVVSTTIKAHPSTPVVAQAFAMGALADAFVPQFLDALTILYGAYPALNDGGFSGYGLWSIKSASPVVGPFTTGYQHAFAVFDKSESEVSSIFASTAAKLAPYNGTSLFITTQYISFPSYAAYYATMSGVMSPVGSSNGALGSRFLDKTALTKSSTELKAMLTTVGGTGGQSLSNNFCLVGGGQVFKDAADPNSGVNPAWRTSYVHHVVARQWATDADDKTIQAVHDDVTYQKVGALRTLAPNTGSYMNEADRLDPLYLQDFYGKSLPRLQVAKAKFDPLSVFYCPTCVGSDQWSEDRTGRLCRS